MDRSRLLKKGTILIECSIAMALMGVIAFYVFSSTTAATRATGFAIHEQLLDNYLQNQAAAVRSAPIAPGGTITMPSFSTLTFASPANTVTTFNNVTLNATSAHTAKITTVRRSAPTINGQETWQYLIQGDIPRRLPGDSNPNINTYSKQILITRAVPL